MVRMQVRIVASMPCYSENNVNEQRGRGVFQRSIEGLQALNRVGYGQPGTGLLLDLVYNPNGAFLAPPTSALQVQPRPPDLHAFVFWCNLRQRQYLPFSDWRAS